jgi:VWFA-related protein
MRRVALSSLLLAATSAGAWGQSPPPTFPAGVEVVILDAVVLGSDGQPVRGLSRDDFAIKEDGQAQAIVSFEAVDLPASPPAPPAASTRISTNTGPRPRAEQAFAVVFDDANLSPASLPRVRRELEEFLERGLRDGDVVTVAPTSGGRWWTARLPEGRADLKAFLGRLEARHRPDGGPGRISDHEAMQISLGRDPQVLARVARRYYENGLIVEAVPQGRALSRDLDASPGLLLIRARSQEVHRAAVARLRATLEAVERVAASLAGLRGRKALLLVSEGFIMDPQQPEFREVIRAARGANAAVYFIDARGLEGSLGQAGLPGGGAEWGNAVEERDALPLLAAAALESQGAISVALDTGGRAVKGTARLAEAMGRIAAESRAYYLIGYTSTNARRDGKYRKIEVSVRRPGAEVRARKGYYAPGGEAGEAKASGDSLDPRLRAALDSPYGADGIGLRLASYVLGPAGAARVRVLLVAEADAGGIAFKAGPEGRQVAALDTFTMVVSRDGGEGDRQEKLVELSLPPEALAEVKRTGVPVVRELELAPGVYQARLLVRDRESARLGTVRHQLTVEGAEAFRISTPILTDRVQPGPPGAPPRPLPVAHRGFKAGGRLYCLFEVYGAARDAATGAPRVSSSYVVQGPAGSAFASMEARELKPGPQGQLAQLLSISLQGAAPGDYELVLTVADQAGGKAVESRERFTVEP